MGSEVSYCTSCRTLFGSAMYSGRPNIISQQSEPWPRHGSKIMFTEESCDEEKEGEEEQGQEQEEKEEEEEEEEEESGGSKQAGGGR